MKTFEPIEAVESMIFAFTVAANTTVTKFEKIKADGTVQEIHARFYSGQQLALHVNPYVKKKDNQDVQLLTYPTGANQYLAGNDDYFVLPCIMKVGLDDYLYVQAVNVDLTNDYTCVVHAIIDYYGGKKRVIGGVV